ncbi:hypothetical protein C8F01DRAFT_1288477, partial [Mycena amicta]
VHPPPSRPPLRPQHPRRECRPTPREALQPRRRWHYCTQAPCRLRHRWAPRFFCEADGCCPTGEVCSGTPEGCPDADGVPCGDDACCASGETCTADLTCVDGSGNGGGGGGGGDDGVSSASSGASSSIGGIIPHTSTTPTTPTTHVGCHGYSGCWWYGDRRHRPGEHEQAFRRADSECREMGCCGCRDGIWSRCGFALSINFDFAARA